MLAIHGLLWSFLWYSRPEFTQTSTNLANVSGELSIIVTVGAVFLGVLALLTFIGLTVRRHVLNYLFIIAHGLGSLLTIISILNYWNVRLLWIPCILTIIIPFLIEIFCSFLFYSPLTHSRYY